MCSSSREETFPAERKHEPLSAAAAGTAAAAGAVEFDHVAAAAENGRIGKWIPGVIHILDEEEVGWQPNVPYCPQVWPWRVCAL